MSATASTPPRAKGNGKPAAGVDNARKKSTPTVSIPKEGYPPSGDAKTPKTPADEGLEFFESAVGKGEAAIKVYELRLDPDGGPNKDRSVRAFLF